MEAVIELVAGSVIIFFLGMIVVLFILMLVSILFPQTFGSIAHRIDTTLSRKVED